MELAAERRQNRRRGRPRHFVNRPVFPSELSPAGQCRQQDGFEPVSVGLT